MKPEPAQLLPHEVVVRRSPCLVCRSLSVCLPGDQPIPVGPRECDRRSRQQDGSRAVPRLGVDVPAPGLPEFELEDADVRPGVAGEERLLRVDLLAEIRRASPKGRTRIVDQGRRQEVKRQTEQDRHTPRPEDSFLPTPHLPSPYINSRTAPGQRVLAGLVREHHTLHTDTFHPAPTHALELVIAVVH